MKGYARFWRYVWAWLQGSVTWRDVIAEWQWQRMLEKIER